mgnify:CR=1 FL=1
MWYNREHEKEYVDDFVLPLGRDSRGGLCDWELRVMVLWRLHYRVDDVLSRCDGARMDGIVGLALRCPYLQPLWKETCS